MTRLFRMWVALAAGVLLSAQAQAAGNASFEQQVIDLVNEVRAANGLVLLQNDPRLHAAALAHSLDMATTPCFGHESCDGTDTFVRIARYYPSAFVSENIAAGFTNPEQVVMAWMNSTTGHRENILNPAWRGIGVGYWFEAGTPFGHYWTQDFGTLVPVPEPASLLLMAGGLALLVARRRAA